MASGPTSTSMVCTLAVMGQPLTTLRAALGVVAVARLERLVDAAPAAALGGVGGRIGAAGLVRLLLAQLLEALGARRVELAARQRRRHRAAGLPLVGAVAKAALLGQGVDVGKRAAASALRPRQAELAQAGRVDEQA